MSLLGLGWRQWALAWALFGAAPAAASECVITLHGLLRGEGSMQPMADFLMQSGYQVVNLGYPSRDAPIAELAATVIPAALERCEGAERVHFVTHSLGGILVRHYLTDHNVPNLGRTVMLGPPNGGSEIVDKLGDLAVFEWLNGPAGQQLGTGPDSVPNQLGPVNYEVGVIAGTAHEAYLAAFFPEVERRLYPDADAMISMFRTGKRPDGTPLTGRAIAWRSESGAVAGVDGSGLVTGIGGAAGGEDQPGGDGDECPGAVCLARDHNEPQT